MKKRRNTRQFLLFIFCVLASLLSVYRAQAQDLEYTVDLTGQPGGVYVSPSESRSGQHCGAPSNY